MKCLIDHKLKELAPALSLGILTARINNRSYHEPLWKELKKAEEKVLNEIELSKVNQISEIAALRSTYKKAGKDPSRYRGSAEALLRRILNKKGLYQINTMVDLNNLVSLETKCSVGTYDFSVLESSIVFRLGEEGESYKGIGKEEINLHHLPVLCDQIGPFGSPTSDSERTMITLDTKQIMMVIFSFAEDTDLNEAIYYARKQLEFVQGSNIHTFIVQ